MSYETVFIREDLFTPLNNYAKKLYVKSKLSPSTIMTWIIINLLRQIHRETLHIKKKNILVHIFTRHFTYRGCILVSSFWVLKTTSTLKQWHNTSFIYSRHPFLYRKLYMEVLIMRKSTHLNVCIQIILTRQGQYSILHNRYELVINCKVFR